MPTADLQDRFFFALEGQGFSLGNLFPRKVDMLTGMRHMEKTAMKERGQRLRRRVQHLSSICSQCPGAIIQLGAW